MYLFLFLVLNVEYSSVAGAERTGGGVGGGGGGKFFSSQSLTQIIQDLLYRYFMLCIH